MTYPEDGNSATLRAEAEQKKLQPGSDNRQFVLKIINWLSRMI
jgi:hypothetical protein